MAAVHPRACGEQGVRLRNGLSRAGSSPRMRGTGADHASSHQRPRFIPAHAGNRRRSTSRFPQAAVHPRACGEQSKAGPSMARKSGSSPRMRGTGRKPVACRRTGRFIPAHAGNRLFVHRPARVGPVHPRACGEQGGRVVSGEVAGGSSPRMRGTVPGKDFALARRRFIPAHAGNRQTTSSRSCASSVHPRACGEQSACRTIGGMIIGSSPRMRGTAVIAGGDDGIGRFIPAHAGNSPTGSCAMTGSAVHPRACGEQ